MVLGGVLVLISATFGCLVCTVHQYHHSVAAVHHGAIDIDAAVMLSCYMLNWC
jgi:hypothetical protein